MIPWLAENDRFPPVERALEEPNGLLAAGADLSLPRLILAYESGIFPWYSEGQPLLWWSPDPRMVLPVAEFRLSHSLKKTLRRFVREPGHEVRIDSATRRVIEACAMAEREGQDGTWIVPAMVEAYVAWQRSGRVHSFETWIDGELVGGLYGVAIGRMFYGESMFARRTDASKIALAALVCFARESGIELVDCQQNTRHLASMGAREISREAFERHLTLASGAADIGDWTYHASMWRRLGLAPPGTTDA